MAVARCEVISGLPVQVDLASTCLTDSPEPNVCVHDTLKHRQRHKKPALWALYVCLFCRRGQTLIPPRPNDSIVCPHVCCEGCRTLLMFKWKDGCATSQFQGTDGQTHKTPWQPQTHARSGQELETAAWRTDDYNLPAWCNLTHVQMWALCAAV